MATYEPKVWLITGCSTGFGRAITLAALAHGDKVIATARKPEVITDLADSGALALQLDVTASDDEIAAVVKRGVDAYGRVDILLSNAGYCSNGTFEEVSAEEAYAQFNTNVFGGLAVLRAVLPYMREQKSGVVAFMGSMLGWRSYPATGMYGATKFTLAGITYALRGEVAPFGIEATVLEPGNFRTKILSHTEALRSKNSIADYEAITTWARGALSGLSGAQPGDTDKFAVLVVELLTKTGRGEGKTLPVRLPIGADGVEMARGIIAEATKDLDEWESVLTTGLAVEESTP